MKAVTNLIEWAQQTNFRTLASAYARFKYYGYAFQPLNRCSLLTNHVFSSTGLQPVFALA
jgi:hypothetical protein